MPLTYQIKAWDPANGITSLWVHQQSIKGNTQQEIKLCSTILRFGSRENRIWVQPDIINIHGTRTARLRIIPVTDTN
jgi:hypothetical protein